MPKPAQAIKLANSSSSAESIGYNSYLLNLILLHLPAESLARLKFVSKLWHSEISSPHFVKRYNNVHPPSVSGLLLIPKHQNDNKNSLVEHISLGQNQSYIHPLNFRNIKLLHSCNGLFLCFHRKDHSYYVFNLTTRQKKRIPGCPDVISTNLSYYSLAFDPKISPHYRIICVAETEYYNRYKIYVYSSESGHWTPSKETAFPAPADIDFSSAIYCNGSVHWAKRVKRGLYYNIMKDTLHHMPESPREEQYSCEYIGHSGGRLHSVFTMEGLHYYEVFEMEKDYSTWNLTCRVNLNVLAVEFPKMMMDIRFDDPRFMYQCQVLSILKDQDGDIERIIMSIPGEVIVYDFKKKSSWKICKTSEKDKVLWYGIYHVFEYFESISPVCTKNM